MAEQAPAKVDKLAKLRALQERFENELPARLDAIEQAWLTLKAGISDDSDELHRVVHSLAGSAGTFGHARLGVHAKKLEQLIQQSGGAPAEDSTIEAITEALLRLRALAKEGPDKSQAIEAPPPDMTAVGLERPELIYVLEDDVNLAADTAQQLQLFGYHAEVFHSVADFETGVARQVPDAVVADIHLPEGPDAGPRTVEELRINCQQPVPVIFVSGHNTWQDRLNAVRAGGQAYLSKPLNFTRLLDELDAISGTQQEAPFRILIVEDTVLLAEHYAAVLQSTGMQTAIVNDPAQILDVLPGFHPDLVLMDIYMPGCSGIEAAQVIRQHAAYSNLSIIYLSTERGLDKQLEALQVGGDGFLQKPISDTHLVEAVSIRAKRFRSLKALMTCDSLTRLLNHLNLKLALERELSLAKRRHGPLSFAMIDIDHFKSVNDEYGHPVGDRVIKGLARLLTQRLRKTDIIARYGGEEFAVIFPDTEMDAAVTLLDALREDFGAILYSYKKGSFTVSFTAGVASCPPYQDMDRLIHLADATLYEAKQAGRNRIHQHKAME